MMLWPDRELDDIDEDEDEGELNDDRQPVAGVSVGEVMEDLRSRDPDDDDGTMSGFIF